MTPPSIPARRPWFVVAVTGLAGAFQIATGAWAFLAPRSFYDVLATFPPYHVHFLHDIGAFLIGLGVVMLAALWWRDTLLVVLCGGTVAAVLHWVSHLRDQHLGGMASDPWTLGAFALLLVVATFWRLRSRHARGAPPSGDRVPVEAP